jgi:hypothetical protein
MKRAFLRSFTTHPPSFIPLDTPPDPLPFLRPFLLSRRPRTGSPRSGSVLGQGCASDACMVRLAREAGNRHHSFPDSITGSREVEYEPRQYAQVISGNLAVDGRRPGSPRNPGNCHRKPDGCPDLHALRLHRPSDLRSATSSPAFRRWGRRAGLQYARQHSLSSGQANGASTILALIIGCFLPSRASAPRFQARRAQS